MNADMKRVRASEFDNNNADSRASALIRGQLVRVKAMANTNELDDSSLPELQSKLTAGQH